MGILVVGSVALDSVKSAHGEAEEVLGGSATYFAWAASYFAPVNLVAAIGEDFPVEHRDLLERKGIDLEGLEVRKGKTFRWSGRYGEDPNERETVSLCLNVFQDFHPRLSRSCRQAEYIFLANIDPELHLQILEQLKKPVFVVTDTMDIWIEKRRELLLQTLKKTDILLLNDSEAVQLTGEHNLVKAARSLLSLGPERIIIKKGEHGAMLFSPRGCFITPAYPVDGVKDPTGAGDSFAGGLVGYIAQQGGIQDGVVRRGIVYGTVLASFTVEDFSIKRLENLTREDIEKRYSDFERMVAL